MLNREKQILVTYNMLGVCLVSFLIFWSYQRQGLLNTNIVLGGWDAPFYLWQARTVLTAGPIYFMNRMTYPMLYPQLLAGISVLTGNLVWTERILPEIMAGILMGVYSLFAYRASGSVHVAGLTSILTSLSPGFLWIVGEYHRTNLALVFAWLGFLVVADRNWTNSPRKLLIMGALLLLAAFTEFEVFAVMGLTLLLYSVATKSKRSFAVLLSLSLLPIFAILAAYPQFLSIHYVNLESESYVIQRPWIYSDLTFWSIGTIGILPLVLLGAYAMAKAARHHPRSETLTPLILTLILVVPALAISQTTLNGLGIRAFLVIPFPLIIAVGIGFATSWCSSISRNRISTTQVLGTLTGTRRGKLIGFSLSVLVILSLAAYTVQGSTVEMVPFFSVSGYSKVLAADHFLRSHNLAVPIYMFAGSSLWSADEYRAYIGADLGDHLAYFGDLSNLLNFQPTWSHLPYPEGNIANFTSVKYLRDLMGNRGYLIYFQSESIRTYSDLMKRPVVFIAPEIYDSPVPFYAQQFSIGNGIYIIPNLTQVLSQISPSMLRQSDGGSKVVSGYVNGSRVTVDLGSGSTWYNVTQFPGYLKPVGFLQGGAMNYPEYNSRRPSGQYVTTFNDVADSVQNWQSSTASFSVNATYQKDGNASLSINGRTDTWGNLWASYDLPRTINISKYDQISFWGSVGVSSAQWVVVLHDVSGREASYWNNLGSPVNSEESGRWNRIVVNLNSPTSEDSGFDFGYITTISIVVSVTSLNSPLTFHIDDLTLGSNPPPTQLYEEQINPSEEAEAIFVAD